MATKGMVRSFYQPKKEVRVNLGNQPSVVKMNEIVVLQNESFPDNEIGEEYNDNSIEAEGYEFEEFTFKGLQWKSPKLGLAFFDDCDFEQCQFEDVDCSYTQFNGSEMFLVTWQSGEMEQINLTEVKARVVGFSDLNMYGSTLCGGDFQKTGFIDCDMSSCDFEKAGFKDCTFENVDFTDSVFERTVFKNCDFKGCTWTDTELIYTVFQECKGSSRVRNQPEKFNPDVFDVEIPSFLNQSG